jgi:hypothetical protein
MRFCTGTFIAAIVRGVTVPVGARPWRTWKRFTASASASSKAPVVWSAARSPLTISRLRRISSMGPAAPMANFASDGMFGQPPRTAMSE